MSAPTAITDPATDITCTTPAAPAAPVVLGARSTARTNAQGLPSTYTFTYGTSPTLAAVGAGDPTTIGPFNAGDRIDDATA